MRNLIYTCIAIIFLSSCSSVSKTTYKDAGVYFEITPEFKIGKKTTWKRNHVTYIPIYLKDEEVYAKFSFVWLPTKSDLDWELRNYTDALKSVYKPEELGDLMFSEIKSTNFGAHTARQIDYRKASDGPRVGSYIAFHCDSSTVVIGYHTTVEGMAAINRCRDLMEKTYYCIQNESSKTKLIIE
ncbi:MAG TPA: hypothetical protein VIN08_23925 [Ohtaekwangia sp.]|uniref:hypothetical protein n=1 Tax=Ohtaekwangia sp. TaxID=2066019 RepID=UPI002F932EB0